MANNIFQLAEPVEDMLPKMKDRMPPENITLNMADTFKILCDHTRVKILYALSLSELCVADIADLAGVSQSAVSHQLRILRNSKLVTWKKSGKQVFYALQSEGVRVLIKKSMEHSTG